MQIKEVIKKDLCLGCGICTYDGFVDKMKYSPEKGMKLPVFDDSSTLKIANQICPAGGYDIVKDAHDMYPNSHYSIDLGFFKGLYAAHSNNKILLENASSGGVMTELLLFLLNNKIVDKVAVTKFIYTEDGPSTITILTNNIDEIIKSQGSKYCPVDISNVIKEIKKESGKIAYIGTPCQIAGIRQIQKLDRHFKEKVVLTIANFCGGFKSFKQIQKISQRHSVDYKNINFLRYRGGGQPGSMLISDKYGAHFEASYLKYGGFTGYSKLLRCHLCVDATGELADISMGDAWLDKYLTDVFPWSIVLTRSDFSMELINEMYTNKLINLEHVSQEDVCLSQSQNLHSKKKRQLSRFRFYKMLNYSIPVFDGGYYLSFSSLKTEFKVYFSHRFKELLEKCGLYKYFRIVIRKEY